MSKTKPSTALARRDRAVSAPVLRELPQSLAAEAAVLGSMIVDPRCIPEIMGQLAASDFYHSEHILLYEAIRELYEKNEGQGIDGLLVRTRLAENGTLARIGDSDEQKGLLWLSRIVETVPSSANAQYYAGIVREKAMRRTLIAAASDILNTAYDEGAPIENSVNDAQAQLYAIIERGRKSEAESLGDLAIRAFEDMSRREKGVLRGLSSGFYEMDDLTGGFRKGDMILIAGRPSMGKTSLAMDILMHVGVIQNKSVVIFSLEMSREQLAERAVCSWAEVDSQKAVHGMLTQADFNRIVEAAGKFKDANIFIDDGGGLTPFQLRARARQLQRKYGIDLIMVDYLQLMDAGSRAENRQQEVTFISRQLKATARELNIPIIVLSQLNRAPEGREDHRPRMSDLRESGSLEQDADLIIMLHREDYYHRGQPNYQNTGTAEAIITKQRKGPTGTVKLTFREQFSKFVNHCEIPETFLPKEAGPSRYEEPF